VLPFSYALRNLGRRATRTALTLGGVALVAFLVILMAAFARGLDRTVAGSGRADVAVVTGSTGETDLVRSFVSLGVARQIANGAPGVLEVDGRRAASVELHAATRVGDRVGLLRGVTPEAYLVHPVLTFVEGVEPRRPWEIGVGRLAAARMGLPDEALAVGRKVALEGREWTVSGRFAAPGTVLEAEVWARLDDALVAMRRVDVSAVALRMTSPEDFPDVLEYVRRPRFETTAIREAHPDAPPGEDKSLFGTLRSRLAPLASVSWLMAGLVLVGGVFACTNTMFAAVLARTREMGTLRAIGYGPFAIGASLLQEALAIGAAGGFLGFAAATALGEVPLRYPAGAFYLDVGSGVRFAGLGAALLAGFLGGLLPAVRALRLSITDSLGGKL
jgi:putative ABC transport system permease protein